ncbi:unnamed protein product [Danaus chrysippus]|uniref:(African queen) hypothetical protein n=1 Tax=Danaus chrysippus TaxID=151541 RepID=A0A8J2W8A1_9NEOP|nr:unnamed protein product [Danaus chrysippus]
MSAAYIIPLDEMDLGLLPNTYSPKRNMPLWSLNNEQCEFRISYNPLEDQTDKDASTNKQDLKTTMCHICKIDVPVKYLKEHRDGVKHKTYLKIANTALERLKDEINNNVYSEERDSLKYFCPHCTTVTEVCDRQKHDNSTNHKNAVLIDRYITNFLDFYTNSTDNIKNTLESQVALSKPADKLLNAIQNTKPIDVLNNFDMENYLNVLKYKHKMTTNIKVISKGRLLIDIDGSKLEIDEDNFHGILNREGGCVECIVCKEIFRTENKYIHIRGSKHAYRVTMPITGSNCLREIYPSWYHCILCNTITENYSTHIALDSNHNKNFETAFQYFNFQGNITSLDNPKPNNDHLNDNKSFVLNKTSIDGSVISNDSTENHTCKYCNIQLKKNSQRQHSLTSRHIWNTKSPYHYLYTVNTSTCRVCDIDDNNVESHVDSENHKQKYREYLSDNRLVSIDLDKFFCMVCFDVVMIRNELLHTYKPNHKKQMDSVKDDENYYCAICDKSIKNDKNGIKLHNESKKHRKNIATFKYIYATITEIYDTLLSTDSQVNLKCTLCDILVANNRNSVESHTQSWKHIEKYRELLKDNIMEVKENAICCNVCYICITNKVCVQHLRGKKHIKKLGLHNEKLNNTNIIKETNTNESDGKNNENSNNNPGINANGINAITTVDEINEIYNSEINLNETNDMKINVISTIRNEPGINMNESTINEPGSNMNEAIRNEPGTNMNEATINEPGSNMNEAIKNEPGTNMKEATFNEPGSNMNEAIRNEPGVNIEKNEENKANINENVNKINDSDVNVLDEKVKKFIKLFKTTEKSKACKERLQLKRVPLDTWNIREQLCLASAVFRSGDQNWMTVSRALKTVAESNRPPDWYSQKSCAAQYGALLEHVETPKRKKRNSEGGVETPQESILKQLTQQRIQEIQNTLTEMNTQYEQLKNEINEVRNNSTPDERIQELWAGIESAKRARERDSARRAAWLKEREERRARAERTWRPQTTSPAGEARRVEGDREIECATSPAPPSSPLLTSLLKSSPVVTTPQHIPHPASVVDTVSPSAGAPTLSLLLELPHDNKHAAIEHIKSQLVQIEHQLKANSQPPVQNVPVSSVPAVDIDDIEIKAEDVYAFSDIDIHIPPVTSMHKGNVRVLEKSKKGVEIEPVEIENTEVPAMEYKEETPVQESPKEEPQTDTPLPEETQPEVVEEKQEEPEKEEVKISFPEVKFPTPEIKVIQDEQKKEEVKEPEVNPEEKMEEDITEELQEKPAQIQEENVQESNKEETTNEPTIEQSVEQPVEQTVEQPVEQPIEQPVEQPVEQSVTEDSIQDPQDIPLPPENVKQEVEAVEEPPQEPVPEVQEENKTEDLPEDKEDLKKDAEDIKKEDDEDSIPLKEMLKEEFQDEIKSETVEEDTHTETDDDTPMELSREEDRDGKKKRDYSRKKKSDSRTCSGSESAPESPSASDAERQHRLWRKSVMLVYSRLCAHKYASLFLRPITDEEAPGYSVVVKRPMDLTTIRRNIDSGNIRTTAEFQRDVLLMLSNALLYNSSSHSVYSMAKEMHQEEIFNKRASLFSICWECKAIIYRLQRFRKQVQLAQKQLSEVIDGRNLRPNHIQCDICKAYVKQKSFKHHRQSHYTKHVCDICQFVAYKIDRMNTHLKKNHGVDVEYKKVKRKPNECKTPDKETVGCLCTECNKWFEVHSTPLPREQCPTCGKLIRQDLMKAHANTHTHRQTHVCVACDKSFISRASYENHLKYAKTHAVGDILKFKCPECKKGYRSTGELRDHVNYQHMGKTLHKCPICSKALATRRCITRHVKRAHHGIKENDKDKICQTCGKTFRDKKCLREHELIHTGERPLSCDICGRTFRQSASLYTHRRRVHNIVATQRIVVHEEGLEK